MFSLWARDARMVFVGATFCGQGREGGMAKGNGFVRRVDCPASRLSAASRARGGAAQPGRAARVPAAGARGFSARPRGLWGRPPLWARLAPPVLRAGKLAISGHETELWHAGRAPSPEEGAPSRRKPRSAVSTKPMRRRIGADPCQNAAWWPKSGPFSGRARSER